MKLSFASLLFFRKKTDFPPEPGALRRTIFLWSLGCLAIALVCLLAIDGYLFYTVRVRAASPQESGNASSTSSPDELDDVLRLLDQREQEFTSLLQAEVSQ
ncbi:MAG: hypothetical protein HYT41_01465 [Candidatus Sungbacteria bacterium]|nr:hypothetical protein [Candidatus Sungbacteria bacterium]